MARENIRIATKNLTFDQTYFYSLSDSSQTLQVKGDDGTTAFSYPTDTTILNTVDSLEWDGIYFWSQETKTGADGFIIRKWAIDSFILKQLQAFTFTNGATHTYQSNDMAVEHYCITVGDNDNGGGGTTVGLQDINVTDTSMMAPGDVLNFVRSRSLTHERYSSSLVETAVVQTVLSSTRVRLTALMTGDPWGDGFGFRGPLTFAANYTPDLIYVTKAIWVLNDFAPSNPGTAALYKINAANGSNIVQYSGTQFSGIKGSAFYTKYNTAGSYPVIYNTTIVTDSGNGGPQQYLFFVNGSSLLFYNVTTNLVDRSLALSNVKADLVNVWDVFDLAIGGYEPNISLFRLQIGTTFGNPAADESWSPNYNYEKTLLRSFVNAIALVAEPSIIPADGVATSLITATVTDQYSNPVVSKTVNWTDDSGSSRVSPTSSVTDSFGRASTTYTAGSTEDDVKVTASVVNGLI